MKEGLERIGIGLPESKPKDSTKVSLDAIIEHEADAFYTSGNIKELEKAYNPAVLEKILRRYVEKYGRGEQA